jgi:hypothetical protein
MRGKKVDNEFISNFIESSVNEGCVSLEGLMSKVNSQLNLIDNKIKEAESLKKTRCKLLDVKNFIGKNYDL